MNATDWIAIVGIALAQQGTIVAFAMNIQKRLSRIEGRLGTGN